MAIHPYTSSISFCRFFHDFFDKGRIASFHQLVLEKVKTILRKFQHQYQKNLRKSKLKVDVV